AMRRRHEREWGCDNLELPVSRLAGTRAFGRFVAHIVTDLPRFHLAYNGAIRAYREANRIEHKLHPAPEIERRGQSFEAPFWFPRNGSRGKEFVPTAGEVHPPAPVRPRALTLTLFARVCLGDFFIHGIGGGKYDEVTDA